MGATPRHGSPRNTVQEVDSTQVSSQRRRSERVPQSLPIIVRGIDLFGQPFEERTATLALNLHGCCYSSKRHLPKDTWLTLELPLGAHSRNARARVVWVQRPRSVREFFQVAVELESPANIWGLESVPEDWATGTVRFSQEPSSQGEPIREEAGAFTGVPNAGDTFDRNARGDTMNPSPDSAFIPSESGSISENPLLRELSAELRRQAEHAVDEAGSQTSERIRRTAEEVAQEIFPKWKEEFERAQAEVREGFTAQIAAKQTELLSSLKSNFEECFREAHDLIQELDRRVQTVRGAAEPAVQTASDMNPDKISGAAGTAAAPLADWNERLNSEMALAQSQWNELLQSSLDSGMQRLVEQLSAHSRELLRSAELKLTERFAELRGPLAETASEARDTLSNVRAALEQEMSRARSFLSDVEDVAGRTKEYSAQLEASSHDALNELHRRLENMLEAQTQEMNRRAEALSVELFQRLNSTVDSLGHQLVERTAGEVESKLAPQLERVPELLRDLATREVQVEESLRLHRERLRQSSENNQREVAAQMAAAISALRAGFESATQETLAKGSEELNANGVRASHAASEAIGRASEWFQQEAMSRLQVLIEQALTAARTTCEETATKAANRLAEQLEARFQARSAEIHQQLDGVAIEVADRTRTQLDEAAEAAASSFGQVLRRISENEAEQFANTSRDALVERTQELDRSAHEVLRNLTVSTEESLGLFRSQMSAQLEQSVSDGRATISAEFASLLDQYAAEREAHQREWYQGLEHLSEEATGKHHERLQAAGDSWMVSSVRRLNEDGQNAIESLMQSAGQSLRNSCLQMFENLAEMIREQTANAAGADFVSPPIRDKTENSLPSQ